MTINYRADVWRRAMRDAEGDVMRVTGTLQGGRREQENLLAYVERAKQAQGAAIERWKIACAELAVASASSGQDKGDRA